MSIFFFFQLDKLINFLNENIGEDEEAPTDGSEFGDSASDSGMPPEVAAAFEEFMANQK